MNCHIQVGETATVRRRWWGKNWSVTYAGMPREDCYSVAITWSMGYNSAAYNLFLAADQREFRLPIGRVTITDVSPTEVRFRFDPTA